MIQQSIRVPFWGLLISDYKAILILLIGILKERGVTIFSDILLMAFKGPGKVR